MDTAEATTPTVRFVSMDDNGNFATINAGTVAWVTVDCRMAELVGDRDDYEMYAAEIVRRGGLDVDVPTEVLDLNVVRRNDRLATFHDGAKWVQVYEYNVGAGGSGWFGLTDFPAPAETTEPERTTCLWFRLDDNGKVLNHGFAWDDAHDRVGDGHAEHEAFIGATKASLYRVEREHGVEVSGATVDANLIHVYRATDDWDSYLFGLAVVPVE